MSDFKKTNVLLNIEIEDDFDCLTLKVFDSEHYIITRKDGLSTLINKSDGSYVYNNLWGLEWYDFDEGYLVKKGKHEYQLVDKKDYKLEKASSSFSQFIRIRNSDYFILRKKDKPHIFYTVTKIYNKYNVYFQIDPIVYMDAPYIRKNLNFDEF